MWGIKQKILDSISDQPLAWLFGAMLAYVVVGGWMHGDRLGKVCDAASTFFDEEPPFNFDRLQAWQKRSVTTISDVCSAYDDERQHDDDEDRAPF